MFTGIVAGTGEVVSLQDARLRVRSRLLAGCKIGASVAVSGVCLTVVERDADVRAFDLSEETLDRSTLGGKLAGERVNVETPLRAGDELGGHIVQGHVDEVGAVVAVHGDEGGARLRVRVRPSSARYVVEKGSVTLDGVSLTVTGVEGSELEVALIPHTLAATTLGDVRPGDGLNVELDVIAKYVERLTAGYS
jgi:riboflavin synthase